ncbi:MAG: hypothetical protein AB1Z66_02950 [Candidatus Limnocylindrales bacterium]
MNAPRDLGPEFRAWLGDIPTMPPELPARTLEATRHTRQRRRWLWFLPGLKPTAGAEDEGGQPDRWRAPEPRPGGLLPAHMGGTTTMISPAKMVAAAAVAALAGTLLLAGPYTNQDLGPPVTDSQELGKISITHGQGQLISSERGTETAIDSGYAMNDERLTLKFDMDDPRLSGTFQGAQNRYAFGTGGPSAWAGVLENENGSWTAEGHGYAAPPSGGWHQQYLLTGEGGYEGLSAILTADQDRLSTFFDVEGAIFTSELPPLPEPSTTTSE